MVKTGVVAGCDALHFNGMPSRVELLRFAAQAPVKSPRGIDCPGKRVKQCHASMKAPLVVLLVTLFSLPLGAEPGISGRTLAKNKAERKQVTSSMIGARDTLLFYTFGEQKAVLRLRIGNRTIPFPVKGTVYLFEPATTVEGLAKWLNNQHSDGLFPEVPEPTLTTDLPDGTCKVTGRKLVDGEVKRPNGIFRKYEVKVEVKPHAVKGRFALEAFEDRADVLVPQVDG